MSDKRFFTCVFYDLTLLIGTAWFVHQGWSPARFIFSGLASYGVVRLAESSPKDSQ